MRSAGIFLIYFAVVLRTSVVAAHRPEFPLIVALLAGYGLLLSLKTGWLNTKRARSSATATSLLAYLLLQSILIIAVLITASYEDFLALLFIPLSLDAVSFFGRGQGYRLIAVFCGLMLVFFLFSDAGPVFGFVMGILYSGLCLLMGGYAYQMQRANAARARNEQTFRELQAAHQQLQGYAEQKASLAIEQERYRLARELHDSVTQTVFSMNLAAQSAQLLWQKEPARLAGQLLHLEELAANAMREIQALVTQLGPRSVLADGLPSALRRLAEDRKRQAGLQVRLDIQGRWTFTENVAAGLYSVAHEALMNVSKHSGTCEASVRLHLDAERPFLEIEDHGRGFDPATTFDQRGHLGLKSMLERAREIGWELSVVSRPGQGTCIRVAKERAGGSG